MFQHSNLPLVTALVSYGAEVINTTREGHKVIFCLINCPNRVYRLMDNSVVEYTGHSGSFESLKNLFFSGQMILLPTYPKVSRDMKSIIYGQDN